MSLLGWGANTRRDERPVYESPNELIIVRPRERDVPRSSPGFSGGHGQNRDYWQDQAIMGAMGSQGLGPKITRRNSAQGKVELQAEYNMAVAQAALESETYQEFMVRYAQISYDYGINTGYFVAEWGWSGDVYPDHVGSAGQRGQTWDELVPVRWYTPEEIAQMSPEQLDSLVTGNHQLVAQGSNPWEYQVVGVAKRGDANTTPLLSLDRADGGPIGDHYHRAPPSEQWQTMKTQDPFESTLGVGDVIRGWGERTAKAMAPDLFGNLFLMAITATLTGPFAKAIAPAVAGSAIGQGAVAGAIQGGSAGAMGAFGRGDDPLKGGLMGAGAGAVGGAVGGSTVNKAAMSHATSEGLASIFPDTPTSYSPAIPPPVPTPPVPSGPVGSPASALMTPIQLTPPTVPTGPSGLLSQTPPTPVGGVTLTPPQVPQVAAPTAPTVAAPTAPGAPTLTPPRLPGS